MISGSSQLGTEDPVRQAVELLRCHETLPPGVDDERIEAFSHRFGIPIPPEYRQMLNLTNGPGVGGQVLLGIGTDHWDIEEILELHPEWARKGWLPIAADGCGDYYVVPTKQEFGAGFPVFFIDQCDYEVPSYVAASSVAKFLASFVRNEYAAHGWPFIKSETLATDPDILRFSAARLPWEA